MFAHGNMSYMDDIRAEIQSAAKRRARAKEAFTRADNELRDLLIAARANDDMGPSELARLTGLTREWVAKIAPASPERMAAIRRRLDRTAAKKISES